MGCTSIAQTPIVSGVYTIIFPTLVFALIGSPRLLVVGAGPAVFEPGEAEPPATAAAAAGAAAEGLTRRPLHLVVRPGLPNVGGRTARSGPGRARTDRFPRRARALPLSWPADEAPPLTSVTKVHAAGAFPTWAHASERLRLGA